MSAPSTLRVVATLGTTQTFAWASSHYLPAVLAAPIAAELGLATTTVFAAFSAALLVSGALGPLAGRLIDRHGGRSVLVASNLILAAGLSMLASAQGPGMLFAAWLVLGVGIAAGLYDAAFATLVGLYREGARGPITGITLVAGFASTVGWPLGALIESELGWRAVCVFWALVHLLVCLPANRWLLPAAGPRAVEEASVAAAPPRQGATDRDAPTAAPASGRLAPSRRAAAVALLAFAFAAAAFVAGAMAAHLLRLLEAAGATPAAAVFAGMLIGPAQVIARIAEFQLAGRLTPLASARMAFALHPLGALVLLVVGAPAAAAFALLHGASNGLVTITRGTVPLWLFGPEGYGSLLGRIGGLARVVQAIAPFAFGFAVEAWGGGAVWITGLLMLAAVVALLAIRPLAARRPDAG